MIGWPQLIMISIIFLSLGVCAAKHGEPRKDYNIGISILDTALMITLLWWGGFFN